MSFQLAKWKKAKLIYRYAPPKEVTDAIVYETGVMATDQNGRVFIPHHTYQVVQCAESTPDDSF